MVVYYILLWCWLIYTLLPVFTVCVSLLVLLLNLYKVAVYWSPTVTPQAECQTVIQGPTNCCLLLPAHRLRLGRRCWVSTWWTTGPVKTCGRPVWSTTPSSGWSGPSHHRRTSSLTTSPWAQSSDTGKIKRTHTYTPRGTWRESRNSEKSARLWQIDMYTHTPSDAHTYQTCGCFVCISFCLTLSRQFRETSAEVHVCLEVDAVVSLWVRGWNTGRLVGAFHATFPQKTTT